MRGFCWLTLAALTLAAVASAQEFDFEKDRQPVISLNGLWRFHTGDDPNWAKPDFDDGRWSLLHSDRSWNEQGYKGYSGMAWYRFRVSNLDRKPLAMYLSPLQSSYQLFANGRLIGSYGKMPPNGVWYGFQGVVFDIPQDGSAADICIAIRVWVDPRFPYGGGARGGRLGAPDLIRDSYRLRHYYGIWLENDALILSVIEVLAGLASLALFALRRNEYEYLWFAIVQFIASMALWVEIYFALNPFPWKVLNLVRYSSLTLGGIATIAFYLQLFRRRRTWLFWTSILAFCLISMVDASSIPASIVHFLIALLTALSYAWPIATTWVGYQRKDTDARLLLVPLLFQVGSGLAIEVSFALLSDGLIEDVPEFISSGTPFTLFPVGLSDIATTVFLLAALAILVGRFARTRRGEEGYAREMEAARTVQQVLVPEQTPTIPGFSIESIYQPAQQVGGDFFQIIPLKRGVLIAIGDVSGKGLPAAMTVALIVGALRMVAEQTDSPAEILQGLNRRLLGRGGGFTTCLVARLFSDGQGMIANSGHLAPYRNGEELELDPALPLGLTPDAQYLETSLTLQDGDRITFLTDGVVEAANAHKELFGFERTRQISSQPAAQIAETARHFGQNDDITVLTVSRVPSFANALA